jgi:hypothetical protein
LRIPQMSVRPPYGATGFNVAPHLLQRASVEFK